MDFVKSHLVSPSYHPRRVYPGADARESGYTCHSKETTCDQLYYIEVTSIADIHDGGRLVYSYLLNIKDTVIEKEVAKYLLKSVAKIYLLLVIYMLLKVRHKM